MKRLLSLILALVLMACTSALAEEIIQEFPEAGLTLYFPAEFESAVGTIAPVGGEEIDAGSGVYYTYIFYTGLSIDEMNELDASGDYDAIADVTMPLLFILSIDGNRDFDDIANYLYGDFDPLCAKEIGRAGDMTYYRYDVPVEPVPDFPLFDEYESLLGMVDDIVATAEFYAPVDPNGDKAGVPISFETTDIDGNPISSEALFGEHKYTLLNIWASWCGPCIEELAELEAINGRLAEHDCAVVGLLFDGADAKALKTACGILSKKGVTYTVILPPDNMDDLFPLEYFPTSYIVDQNGIIVGNPIVGAQVDQYESAIMDALGA